MSSRFLFLRSYERPKKCRSLLDLDSHNSHFVFLRKTQGKERNRLESMLAMELAFILGFVRIIKVSFNDRFAYALRMF